MTKIATGKSYYRRVSHPIRGDIEETFQLYFESPMNDALEGCTITNVTWFGSEFHNISLKKTKFYRCDLSGSSFLGAILEDTEFVSCDLSGCTFPEDIADHVEMKDCHFQKVSNTRSL
jgi:uncharacterized protein YjbI with pentapeptide repeats